MEIGTIIASAYAGATMGGVCFIANCTLDKERLQGFEEQTKETEYGLHILVLDEAEREEEHMRFRLVSRSKTQASKGFWWLNEEVVFHASETETIQHWCRMHGIEEKARAIRTEIQSIQDELDCLYAEANLLYQEKWTTVEELMAIQEKINSIQQTIRSLQKRYDLLYGR